MILLFVGVKLFGTQWIFRIFIKDFSLIHMIGVLLEELFQTVGKNISHTIDLIIRQMLLGPTILERERVSLRVLCIRVEMISLPN